MATQTEITRILLRYFPSFYKKVSTSNNYLLMFSFAKEFAYSTTEIERLAFQISVNTATGTFLDDIGRLFLLTRNSGETDADFRSRILAYWAGFTGGGTIEAVQTAVASALGVDISEVTITEIPDLKFRVGITQTSGLETVVGTIQDIINSTKAAGTYGQFELTAEYAEDIFVSEVLSFTPGGVVTGIIVGAYEVGSIAPV